MDEARRGLTARAEQPIETIREWALNNGLRKGHGPADTSKIGDDSRAKAGGGKETRSTTRDPRAEEKQ